MKSFRMIKWFHWSKNLDPGHRHFNGYVTSPWVTRDLMISLLQNHHTIFNAHSSSSLLLLFLSNISAYLCPCHNFYFPSSSIPGSKRNQEESGDGGKVASVEEGVGNAQEPCAETEIYHKEKTKEYVHRFYLVESSVFRPERPQPGTTKRQFLAHFHKLWQDSE